jgi:hypothetical protein
VSVTNPISLKDEVVSMVMRVLLKKVSLRLFEQMLLPVLGFFKRNDILWFFLHSLFLVFLFEKVECYITSLGSCWWKDFDFKRYERKKE